ncbi:Regulatory protein LuxR [Carbonactinospora thermoautotrophica]|uniref:Regulatory protein LuxR n=1 Tax=Carbonactinospora thermoautotrophica TaxID=1469144 RepID=A0A132MWB2_9ACTN|nr:Regulatory protein LuxR [Carbonactinospora thermoautotrophica]
MLRGQPGVGKSALLADAVARAEGMLVLRTSGIESESPLAFAALQRLLRPAMRHADRLPAPQARALRAVFGEEEGDGDRFLVFLAALSLLAETAEQAPVLAVVDDAHWLDDASAAALLFVARRLQVERVAMLFAAREGDVRRFDSGDLPSITLGGIDRDAAAALLTDRAGVPVPAEVSDRLVRSTGGNPLALVELAEALSADQLGGQAPLPAQLPVTEGVERAFLDRYRRLPEPAQALLLVAAADDSARVATVRQAAAALGADDEALHAVERSGLLRVIGSTLELRHPLVRSAVYGAATSFERRRAHRALADVLVGDEDADRRAWHRAASVEEPDEAVVEELDRAAERARGRGGLEAAASAWERAAELTPPGEARAQRLYAAAVAAWLAAQPGRARVLADTARVYAGDPGLRADIARLRARIEWNTGSVHVGHRMILQAAAEVAPHDADRAREMAMFATALASFGASSGVAIDPVGLVPPADESDPPRRRAFAGLLAGLDHVTRGDWAQAASVLRDTFAVAESCDEDDQALLPNLGIAALHLGEDDLALRYHTLLLSRARDTGALVLILYSLTRRGFIEIATGRWTAASAGASEALPLAEGSGQPGLAVLPLSLLALTAALRGEDTFDGHLAAAEQVAAAHPVGVLENLLPDMLHWAKGLRAAAQPATAFHHLEQIAHPMLQHLAAIDRIDAAVRAGQRDTARAWTDELDGFAAATGSAWAAAAVAHGRALLTGGDAAERHFEQALAHHAYSRRTPDRARTELAYGEFLRRARRRVDARAHLRAALEIFEDLGAAPWAERASQELRASGETARRRDPSALTGLTPQELQVARLVAQGMSNRDVAAQLYLSPRTIDFHLRNVFAKLGVSSRAELARLSFD